MSGRKKLCWGDWVRKIILAIIFHTKHKEHKETIDMSVTPLCTSHLCARKTKNKFPVRSVLPKHARKN
jgi:hypothetical protein